MKTRALGVQASGWAVLLASTALCGPALAAGAADTSAASGSTEISEIIVTASKRAENIQSLPLSIQAIDTKKLDELNITNFQDYVKFMPSVSYDTAGPNSASIYMRGVAAGENGNHSGPLPSVGTYLDEQPITTIGGTLDVHIYDMARIEVLPGPQGTLYGASSEAGTLRIITNKPSTVGFSAGYDVEGNTVDHGGQGGVVEGFINVPLASNVAVRIVAFGERDAGYIDNVFGTRTFATSGATIDNAGVVEKDFNRADTIGGRAALKIDLGANWTVTPEIIGQQLWARGVYGFQEGVGDLQVQRFQPDRDYDRWLQASLTVNGKIGRFDLTYSGGYFYRWIDSFNDYTDYSIAYDQYYGSGAYWLDKNGDILQKPQQSITGRHRYDKESNELRIASPASDRFRIIAGLFQERQTDWIIQDYQIKDFGPQISVTGWPGSIWLTDQNRIDRDEAAFAEASYDITPKLTITGGIRGYHYKNSLFGFFGYGLNYPFSTGEKHCIPGLTFRDAPCVDLDRVVSDYGETHKVNLTYRLDDAKLVYFTYSTGYRPGGVNRALLAFPTYGTDTLDNYEVGFKTSWLNRSLFFNGALYDEEWSQFQFSFLGLNSLTQIQNAPQARIRGVEASLEWRATERLTISGGTAYNNAELTRNFCGADPDTGVVVDNCADSDAQAVHGQQLPFTPKFKGNLTGRYVFDLGGWHANVQGSVLYQSRTFQALRSNADPVPGAPFSGTNEVALTGIAPAYTTADFSAGLQRDHLTMSVFIKNAFDSRGQITRATPCTVSICAQAYPDAGAPAAVFVYPVQPLTVGIRIGQTF
ncbi:MAG: TonB-dependent receptor [Caulobacteraceae bacterium]|nr:TonB-dependent receptor [Caulobacteraceae bacterium]